MKLCFDSIEEVKEFVKQLKGTRGPKDKDEPEAGATGGQAPPPIMPPTTQMQGFGNTTAFAPQGLGAAPQAGGFPAAGAPVGPAPEIVAIVAKIVAKLDAGVASGHDPVAALNWFRSELQKAGFDATQHDMASIKAVVLPKMPMPFLENIAKLMAIV